MPSCPKIQFDLAEYERTVRAATVAGTVAAQKASTTDGSAGFTT